MRLVPVLALTLVALGACNKPAPAPAEPATPAAHAAPAAPPPAAPAATPPAAPPEVTQALDKALADAQAFDAKAAGDLAAPPKTQARIHTAAQRALDLARKGDAAGAKAAVAQAEAAHDGLAKAQAAFQADQAAQTQAVQAAVDQCAMTPELAAYPACATLTTEQATLTANIQALGKAYDAAAAAWTADRAKLDEASATLALGR
jgi:hypothetical protein